MLTLHIDDNSGVPALPITEQHVKYVILVSLRGYTYMTSGKMLSILTITPLKRVKTRAKRNV